MNDDTRNLIEDTELSFKLFEFAVRIMCYSELNKIDGSAFGQELQLNLEDENVCFSGGLFEEQNEIVKVAQMNVGAAFAATAISLHRVLEGRNNSPANIVALGTLVVAVRNAFAHGMAAPTWFVKPHKAESVDLSFINGPVVDLGELNGKAFEYSQFGGLAVWYRVKNATLAYISSIAHCSI